MNSQKRSTASDRAALRKLTKAYAVIIDHLKLNSSDEKYLSNFVGSPERCARAILENYPTFDEIHAQLREMVNRNFPVNEFSDTPAGMLTQGPIVVNSMCPHHLYPVRYEAWASYMPCGGRVIGLSKLSRIARLLGRRAVLQEQLAIDIADVLYDSKMWPSMKSAGSAVTLIGTHTCMACRGIESDAMTTVTELRGSYWETGIEAKYLSAIQLTRTAKTF